MENLQEWLLGLDTMILIILILGAFIVWMLRSGEVPMRWLGSIRRDTRPFFYWISIVFYVAILAIVVYAYMDGLRLPISGLFE